jgi:hypothetical protein
MNALVSVWCTGRSIGDCNYELSNHLELGSCSFTRPANYLRNGGSRDFVQTLLVDNNVALPTEAYSTDHRVAFRVVYSGSFVSESFLGAQSITSPAKAPSLAQ